MNMTNVFGIILVKPVGGDEPRHAPELFRWFRHGSCLHEPLSPHASCLHEPLSMNMTKVIGIILVKPVRGDTNRGRQNKKAGE